ncbi:low specificity L-threonine aldolase [soil metagenome]
MGPMSSASRHFASDNYAGALPEVLAALNSVNDGHQVSYGDDEVTAGLSGLFGEVFEADSPAVWPVFNGTGANVVSLMSMTDRWGAVVCSDVAHINTDEGGAPEKVGGLKLYSVAAPDGKLTPELVDRAAWGFDDEHRATPQVLSLTQSTELGTVYSVEEMRALVDHAHSLAMSVHVDGARIANAVASLGCTPKEAIGGADVLSFGGTKNGMLYGEAIVVLNPDAVRGVINVRKNAMQLSSKMRFISAQIQALLTDDLWIRTASHANAMAARLASGVERIDGIEVLHPVQANGVFASLPVDVSDAVRAKGFKFYPWSPSGDQVRWMCSFDTTEADVDAFLAALVSAL